MSDEGFQEAPAADKHFFIKCEECVVMYDNCDLDDVMFHNGGHVNRPIVIEKMEKIIEGLKED